MLDPNTKAAKTSSALTQIVGELRADGNANLADRLEHAMRAMPVGSLARLYDLIESSPTKAEALESLN